MADEGDPPEVEPVHGGEGGEVVGGPGGVLPRRRPASAGADPAVLHVPDGDAAAGEVGGEAIHQVAFPGVVPEPAVEQDGDGVGPLPVGAPEVAFLARLGAVCEFVEGAAVAPGEEEERVPAGVGAAAVEDGGAGGGHPACFGLQTGLAEVPRVDGDDGDAGRSDGVRQGGSVEPVAPGSNHDAGQVSRVGARQMAGGQGADDGGGVAGPEVHFHAQFGPPPDARIPVDARARHDDNPDGHRPSAPDGRRRARAMIVRWISDVPS
jgi:hypothetical protein